MARTHRVFGYGLALLGVLGLSFALLPQVGAQTAERCFVETSFCVAGPFRSFWEQGGLATFGFPLGPQGQPQANPQAAGAPAQVQWFERHRLELHPANPSPYNLLLGRVGAERLEQLGRDWQQAPPSPPQPGCQFFPETGRNLCAPFLAPWQASGRELDGQPGVSASESLALFGLPLTEAQTETLDGQSYTVQWFERARFELHQLDGGVTRVLFGRLGAELLAGGAVGGTLPGTAPTQPVAPTATGAAGGQAPTATRVPPTATRVPPTPTRRPRTATAEPTPENEASSTSAPTSTRAPAATSTAGAPTATRQPTSTAAPPTATRVPPSATPTPSDPFEPPVQPTVPPGFPPDGGLPSLGGAQLSFPNLGSLNIGDPACIDTVGPAAPGTELSFTVTGPQPAGSVQETVTVFDVNNGPGSKVRWRWVPSPDYQPGTYIISATETITGGTITLLDRAAGAGGVVTAVRVGDRISDNDVASCNDGVHGAPGDTFGVVLTGFNIQEVVELYLYGDAGCPATTPGGRACFKGLLNTVSVDGDGQAFVSIPTKATYPIGRYIVLTKAQVLAAPGGPSDNLNSNWEQRIELE